VNKTSKGYGGALTAARLNKQNKAKQFANTYWNTQHTKTLNLKALNKTRKINL